MKPLLKSHPSQLRRSRHGQDEDQQKNQSSSALSLIIRFTTLLEDSKNNQSLLKSELYMSQF